MTIHEEIAEAMPPLSHLECDTCGKRRGVGDLANNLRKGWPTCCKGHSMRLVTVREATA
ncbi:hypothetical protein BN000_00628 [Mycobacterium europaeum]|uniref:Uncharacterized protein n=1 Tax=Mycobacterium europaeum TaxID=761804 RepID=A0A0U1CX41_9MYCO|nr:hypothetical protein BN000_00628 [Mycobacterium europaeum]